MRFASWDSTVGVPTMYGVACCTCASQEMPPTRKARMTPWVTSTFRAFGPSGGFSALTALDTASMPVSDEPPLAKARSRVRTRAPEISSDILLSW